MVLSTCATLPEFHVLLSQGQNMADAIRQIGVGEVTYYRWRQEFGGLDRASEAPEGPRTREQPAGGKVVSDLTLDKLILQEAARGNF